MIPKASLQKPFRALKDNLRVIIVLEVSLVAGRRTVLTVAVKIFAGLWCESRHHGRPSTHQDILSSVAAEGEETIAIRFKVALEV